MLRINAEPKQRDDPSRSRKKGVIRKRKRGNLRNKEVVLLSKEQVRSWRVKGE